MPKTSAPPPTERGVKTGRRENPAIDGPRDKTVCFMLSEGEKLTVDRLALCLSITRSGLLARIVVPFIEAAESGKTGEAAEEKLQALLEECRTAIKERGAFAAETITTLNKAKK